MSDWQKPCPACGEPIATHLAACPHCDADVRERCPVCGLPYTGEPPCCGFGDECRRAKGQLTHEEAKVCTPKNKRANRPDGGTGHGWLRARRAGVGY